MEYFQIARQLREADELEKQGHIEKAIIGFLKAESMINMFDCWIPYILYRRAKCLERLQHHYEDRDRKSFLDQRQELLVRCMKYYSKKNRFLVLNNNANKAVCLAELATVCVEEGKLNAAEQYAKAAIRLCGSDNAKKIVIMNHVSKLRVVANRLQHGKYLKKSDIFTRQ